MRLSSNHGWSYYPSLLGNGGFFLRFGLPFTHTVFGENGHQKRIISKTVSSMKRFENASHLFSCGRTKTEVSEYDDVILHLPLA